jgi:crotonobetainyl-CoA:carnitine CoA-transferase CaiB-like acyl-CoA transferase
VGDEARPVERAPRRGEHTAEVLAELCGYSPDDVAALAEAGAFGPPVTRDPA